jgi:5'-nucleotidase
MMKKLTLLFTLIIALSSTSEAKLLHIIHTNDLHSFLLGYKDGRGGYAKLKAKIEELRADSENKGIEVLQLDAGDFGEGTSFFLTNEGSNSITALGMLGTEISVIGNHDHMLGGKILGTQIRRANIKTKFLSANLVQTPEMDLNNIVFPFADIEKAGTAIRVIGLSTAEAHFQYPLLPGFILPPVQVGSALADASRKAGKKFIIALTHIGQNTDVELAKNSSEIDLIVGGHSHDRITEVRYEKNKKNKMIPIVQAGAHSTVVGSLLLDIKEDGSATVVKYNLHEILPDMPEEQEMSQFVSAVVDQRNQYFKGRWEEAIGESLIPLSGYKNGTQSNKESCWGAHMARMTQQVTNADLALHLAQFEGQGTDPGIITFGDMVENFPHFRNYGDPGWEISTFSVSGKVLRVILKALVNLPQFGINFYGVEYRSFKIPSFIPYLGNKIYAYGFRIKGEKINNKKMYKVALPAEVGHALTQTFAPAVKKLMPRLANTGFFYWNVMEKYIKTNSPIKCLEKSKANIPTFDEE